MHAIDVLNRVRFPPDSDMSAYETVTGDKPRIMQIMPFGCKVYAVKPPGSISKTNIDSRAWIGMNLGRDLSTPGGYRVWMPSTGRLFVTSELYFEDS